MRNIHWMAVLRSCCSIEAYRRHYLGDMDPLRVASFLILERNFPRSMRHSRAEGARRDREHPRRKSTPPASTPPSGCWAGWTPSWNTPRSARCSTKACPRTSSKIQNQIAEAALAVQKAYFLH